MLVSRLAPSPTGALHLGNARTFLLTWLLARQEGWKLILRIEDIDGPRLKRGADRQAMEDLSWLGLDWDQGPDYQAYQIGKYRNAAMGLLSRGLAYPCTCTRSEVETSASAPHVSDGSAVYPGTCRDRYATLEQARDETGRNPCVRFRMPDDVFAFRDLFRGETAISGASLGDFPLLKADGTPSYQLACALDDAESGVTHVIRGDDLLDSTPRQLALMAALGFTHSPAYAHLPLVLGPDGRRLAKRHGDTRLATYRDAGVSPGRVLALLAKWSGIDAPPSLATASDLVGRFDLARLSRGPVTFAEVDAAVLR